MPFLKTLMDWTGGLALIGATAISLLAVIGRHGGWPLHGAIELIQVTILIAGALALIAATLARSHARVHLILDRLAPPRRTVAERICALLAILFYLGLLAGSLRLAIDLWGSQEMSEVAQVPWRWLRLFGNGALIVVLTLLAAQAVGRRRG